MIQPSTAHYSPTTPQHGATTARHGVTTSPARPQHGPRERRERRASAAPISRAASGVIADCCRRSAASGLSCRCRRRIGTRPAQICRVMTRAGRGTGRPDHPRRSDPPPPWPPLRRVAAGKADLAKRRLTLARGGLPNRGPARAADPVMPFSPPSPPDRITAPLRLRHCK